MDVSDMTFFHQASKLICGSLDAKIMLADTLHYLRQFMPAETLHLVIHDRAKNIVDSIAGVNFRQEPCFKSPTELSLEGVRRLEKAWYERVLIVNRPEEEPVLSFIVSGNHSSQISHMALHLRAYEEKLGAVVVSSRGRNIYKPEHARLLALLYDPFSIAMANTLKHQEVLQLKNLLADDNRYLSSVLHQQSGDKIIGKEGGLKTTMAMVQQVAPLNTHVLLLGETGVGKEVVANAIHHFSPRRNGPLIKVNCGALPDTLIDSELFGYEKGAFTGAVSTKRGRFERAHNGTIFLDEIGDLPLPMQNRLLRVIQEKQIERVGGSKSIDLNIRIIAATHRDLQQMVNKKTFRHDLWFRLNVYPIRIPPLRQRKDDIPALAQHFVQKKCHEMKLRTPPKIESGQMEKLMLHDWPGNVRELENLVERALIRAIATSSGDNLIFTEAPISPLSSLSSDIVSEQRIPTLDELNRAHIEKALKLCKYKVEGKDGAAIHLDINPATLRSRMRKLGVEFGRNRNV